MAWFLLARLLFTAAVASTAFLLRPVGPDPLANVLFGLGLAGIAVVFEWLLRDLALTSLIGALLGGAIGLAMAVGIGAALFWADHGDRRVAFLDGFLLLLLPYLGLVIGGRKGEWLEPARLMTLFRASGPRRRYKILDVATPGSAVLCSVEGSRPILVEVQALASTTSYGMAKRMAVGIDPHRLSLLLAVLEKRAGLHLVTDDVFVNIAGGMTIDEPAADLAIVSAVASSVRNRPLLAATAVFGEVGLGGEVRGVPQAGLRIREAEQMGFTRIVLPAANVDGVLVSAQTDTTRAELIGVRHVGEALDALLA